MKTEFYRNMNMHSIIYNRQKLETIQMSSGGDKQNVAYSYNRITVQQLKEQAIGTRHNMMNFKSIMLRS